VAGRAETTRQILIYSVTLFPGSLLPYAFGFAGAIYGVTAAVCCAAFGAFAWRLRWAGDVHRRAASRPFLVFLVYPLVLVRVLLAALLADTGASRWSSMLSSVRAAPVGSVQAQSVVRSASATRVSTNLSLDEV